MSGTAVKIVPAVRINKIFNAARERVFEAWTNEEELKDWFIPSAGYTVPFVEIDLRKNTRYRIAMKDPSGHLHLFGGVIQNVIVPEKLAYTWSKNAGGTQQHKSFITVKFIEQGEQTEIQLTHENFVTEQEMKDYESGWKTCFGRLDKLLSNG